jgi:heterodisulfide reductase subunit A-like polyferredoxin
MVVGGGIAGMQASLDLADQGFKVYLVEKETAIGGKMAQLDKTFPTNDCAMCTISPKLVEAGRHPNIEIITGSEVVDVTGQAGDFQARIQTEPRYIDLNDCVACNDCVDVCPVPVPDIFNESLIERRAVYKQYPQAVPNAYAITKAGIAPCRDACPAGQRAQGYIALIRDGRWEDAYRVIKMDNPFPGICGRICNHRCETVCNRGKVEEPINIRALKRFITDKIYDLPRPEVEPAEILYPDDRVAIIGAGPSGLTAAQDLIQNGYPVTVFEAMPVAGGMLRLGVPEYRLPTEIIEREVQDIVDLGVDLKLNHRIDDLDALFDQGFKAVLIAVGAHEGIRLPIPGANFDGVIINTRFLRDVRLGKYDNGKESDAPPLGDRVLVLGGGNVAIDCARTAIRLGKEVHLACLESRAEMPAHDWEIEAAQQEGVVLHPSRSFERILGTEDGRVRGMEMSKVSSFSFDDSGGLHVEKTPSSFSFDDSGGLHVEKTPDSSHELKCDTVIFSVGQRAGLAFIPDDAGVGITKQQTIAINPNTLAATKAGVFASGDSVSGTAFVIESVASGHTVASSIIRYLQGKDLEPPPRPELPVVELTEMELANRIARGEITHQPRVPLPELSIDDRVSCFAEVEVGYDEESAREEAARCLACGICSECMSCVFACGKNAVHHDMVGSERNLNIGAIILAPGYQTYQAELSQEYGFGRFPNVVTSLQYERMLSASGPTEGHVRRPSDQTSPKRIAFLQCVGSRDQNHDYCSAVCCMYAAKEAIMTIEHAQAEKRTHPGSGDVHCQVFFIDTRAYSKGYEEYYMRAQKKYGIVYTRCRISEVKQNPANQNLIIRYSSPYENQAEPIEEEFDLVVLSVGMEISNSVQALGRQLGIELDEYGFCHTTLFDPLQTSRAGLYVAGPFREPKDIPETVIEASGAAAKASQLLSPVRHSLATKKEYPEERSVVDEEPKVGVFVCHCGSNIGGYLDVPEVAEYAKSLPNVIYAEDNLYTCSQDTIAHIIDKTKELGLNRVVVSSCTPITHEPLFQDAIRQAGLNPHLFEMANIRNQCSWVHSTDYDTATIKAKSLTRMAVARAGKLNELEITTVPVISEALIIGGGAAGMSAALNLGDQGYHVHLVERKDRLGGNLNYLQYFTSSNNKPIETTPKEYLADLTKQITNHPYITVYLSTSLLETEGFKGNFNSKLAKEGKIITIKHGVIIIATGGVEYKGEEYEYGKSPNIKTQLEFEELLSRHLPGGNGKAAGAGLPDRVTMIQCIGPAEQYCSRICCTTALKNALKLKEIKPEAEITIINRDLRTYGFKERLYTEARELGVRFIHYEFDHKPSVTLKPGEDPQRLEVKTWEPILGRDVDLPTDMLVLSTPIIPDPGTQELANLLKCSTDMDGFFMEAHVKLRPVDFAADGIFMAGMAHYPKFLDETIAQAQAAASRAARVLSQESILTNAKVAQVDPSKCVGCLTCVRICPYDVPKIQFDLSGVGNIMGAAYIEPAVCHGCGSCASECPAQAIQIRHSTDTQTLEKINALLVHMEHQTS